ncbi:hypothetical protein D8B22_15980 [Verminephrobacter aporrectodeae subsp. tuberculatae]|uniref:SwmB domain-containing protein n=1 Tax=Verminephrobacter aporrectodeae TaxID=1110389 RepID=UPI002243F38D|nr:SwmB domain-containing protein [Verminephrobacter aporrectodeae]MCW8164134.1 hypothetical protein [Verminephrobacter aporrectodeae subsp. tuberculatae]MCW8170566.1 hypothetical protein [Verminephrobacter aporrectodeae subsp. tuberculatae]
MASDTKAPKLIITGANAPTAAGDQLVLTYDGPNDLDRNIDAAGFTVTSTTGTAITVVSIASVDAKAQTITLTLSRAITTQDGIKISYTPPANGNGVQDVAGNDAQEFADQDVINNTAGPVFVKDYPGIEGNKLTLAYTGGDLNSHSTPSSTAFAVFVNDEPKAISSVDVIERWFNGYGLVTLYLDRPVAGGDTVTISYTKPKTGAVLQDTAGNAAANFSNQSVDNATRPAPVFISATVNGTELVLTYSKQSNLDEAALDGSAGFSVVSSPAGTAIAVNSARVNAATKTITLTLGRTVADGETVSVSYTKPGSGNVVQDKAGNDAADFRDQNVTNLTDSTAPVFSSATVTGTHLVLTYTERNSLDGVPLAGSAGFTVRSDTGPPITVSSASVDAKAKTVTLTLDRAVANGETVTVNYTKPGSGNVVQDKAGNDAANLNGERVTNLTPDSTAPVFSSATVDGAQLVLTYTERNDLDGAPLAGSAGFTVRSDTGPPITVNSARVDAKAKTVTLTLDHTVANGETVTVSYTKPGSGNVVQDMAGNDAANLNGEHVTNLTPDTTAPVFSSATVDHASLVLTYTERNALNGAALDGSAGFAVVSHTTGKSIPVTSASVDAKSKTVTLTLDHAVADGEAVSVSYTKPGSGNVVQDKAGNDAADFRDQSVNNLTDSTAPVFSSAMVNGTHLVLSYTERNDLDGTPLDGSAGFAVSGAAGTAIPVSSVSVDAAAKTVTLTLGRAVANGEVLTVSYTKPTTPGHVVQDKAGNDAANFHDQSVNNLTPPPPPAPSHVASDADNDGVPNAQENQATGPAGVATGDGNADGIADSAQAAVGSINVTAVGGSSTSITLVADSQDGNVSPGNNDRITSLEQKDAPAESPQGLEMPIAQLRFEIELDTSGSSEKFSLYVDRETGVNGYWIKNNTDTWTNLASEPYGGKMATEDGRLRLDFSITDGGQFDMDGKADGVITAPGAAGYMPLSIVGLAPDMAHTEFWL